MMRLPWVHWIILKEAAYDAALCRARAEGRETQRILHSGEIRHLVAQNDRLLAALRKAMEKSKR